MLHNPWGEGSMKPVIPDLGSGGNRSFVRSFDLVRTFEGDLSDHIMVNTTISPQNQSCYRIFIPAVHDFARIRLS